MRTAAPVGQVIEPRIFEEEDRGVRRIRTIQNVVARGGNLDARDCSGDDPLISAAQNHIVPGVRGMICAGADVHSRNNIGRTALMQAIVGPSNAVNTDSHHFDEALSQILRELLGAGARIDDTDADGNNVLHLVFKANTTEQLREETQISTLRILLNKPGINQLFQARNSAHYTPSPRFPSSQL